MLAMMVGWFGVNVGVAGVALARLLGHPGRRGRGGLFAVVMLAVVGLGLGVLSWSALVAGLATTGARDLRAASWPSTQRDATLSGGLAGSDPIGFLPAVALVIGYGAAFSLRTPDFTHDLARTRQVVWCALVGLAIPTLAFGLAGAALYAATGTWDLADVLRDLGSPTIAYLFVAVGFTGSVLTNIWSGALSLADVAPRVSHRAALLAVAAAGTCLAAAGFDELMLSWLTIMALAAPGLVAICAIHVARGGEPRPRMGDDRPGLLGGGLRVRAGAATGRLFTRAPGGGGRAGDRLLAARPAVGAETGGREGWGREVAIETTAARGGAVGLDCPRHRAPGRGVVEPAGGGALRARARVRATRSSPRAAPSSSRPAPTPAGRPRTSTSSGEPGSEDRVWWGAVNQPIDPAVHASLGERLRAHLGAGDVYVIDAWAGADPAHRLPLRVVTESAWHALFARTLFIEPTDEELAGHRPEALVLHAPSFAADPAADGTRAGNFVILHLTDQEILIGGTQYAGEIKKSIFTLMNDRLPQRGVLSMHCSANVGADGRVAVFFGLSGTGKTTLSTDSQRPLIGDDEHGWGEDGVFNIEGGCYAKVIKLSPEAEPEIYATTRTFGTVLENVVMDPATRRLDLDDDALTENTRGAYPLASIPNHVPDKRAGHPSTIVMLTADAFGVLPAGGEAHPRGGDDDVPRRLHRQGGRHRGRRRRAAGGLQRLLRGALPAPAAVRLRGAAARADRGARRERLAGQHRLDRRPLRHRLAHADRRHPRDRAGRGLGRPGRRPHPHRPGLRLRGADGGPGRRRRPPRPPRHLGRPGRLRRRGRRPRRQDPGARRGDALVAGPAASGRPGPSAAGDSLAAMRPGRVLAVVVSALALAAPASAAGDARPPTVEWRLRDWGGAWRLELRLSERASVAAALTRGGELVRRVPVRPLQAGRARLRLGRLAGGAYRLRVVARDPARRADGRSSAPCACRRS